MRSRVVSRPINGMIDDPRGPRRLPNFTAKLNESSRSEMVGPGCAVGSGQRANKISTAIELPAALFLRAFDPRTALSSPNTSVPKRGKGQWTREGERGKGNRGTRRKRDGSLKSLVRFIYRERKAGLAGIGSKVGSLSGRCLHRRVIDSDLADSDRRTRRGVRT